MASASFSGMGAYPSFSSMAWWRVTIQVPALSARSISVRASREVALSVTMNDVASIHFAGISFHAKRGVPSAGAGDDVLPVGDAVDQIAGGAVGVGEGDGLHRGVQGAQRVGHAGDLLLDAGRIESSQARMGERVVAQLVPRARGLDPGVAVGAYAVSHQEERRADPALLQGGQDVLDLGADAVVEREADGAAMAVPGHRRERRAREGGAEGQERNELCERLHRVSPA